MYMFIRGTKPGEGGTCICLLRVLSLSQEGEGHVYVY
jgi:hypothetical protein